MSEFVYRVLKVATAKVVAAFSYLYKYKQYKVMAIPLIGQISFEEERSINDPLASLQWVADNYRASMNQDTGHGAYEWEPCTFANTKIISAAGEYFKKYGAYNDIDPRSRHYKLFWDREEYRRKHGVTVPIKVPEGGCISDKDLLPMWVPGRYYGHLNYGPIKRTVDPTDADVERALKNSLQVAELQNNENKIADLLAGLSNKTVKSKKYDFMDFWDGHFHTYVAMDFAGRNGWDFGTLKGRRKGFSYIGAWVGFDTYDMIPGSTTLLIAYDMKYLNKGKEALFNMIYGYSNHINAHTDWRKNRLKENTEELKSGYRINGVAGDFGWQSEIVCLSAADNPNCARGKDAAVILYEECGSFPNLGETRTATKAAAETGGITVGQSFYWGTVGKNEHDMNGLTELFYEPFANDCIPFKNKWSAGVSEFETCGMFFGHYQNLLGEAVIDGKVVKSIDPHGNSLFEEAKIIDDYQDKIKQRTEKYHQWRAERPRNIEEALSPATNNIFKSYQERVGLQLEKLLTTHKDIGTTGKYVNSNGIIEFWSTAELKARSLAVHPPIYDIPQFLPKDYDKHGCIVEWAQPHIVYEDNDPFEFYKRGKVQNYVPEKLYVIWHDPFATDKEGEEITRDNSYGVAYVYEYPNNITKSRGGRIVASWIGRPETMDAYNEQLFYMARRWNAQIFFENDRGTVKEYAMPRKLTSWLKTEPELLSMTDIAGKTGRKYGMSIGKHVERKNKGLILLHDFFKEPVGEDLFGNPVTFLENFYCRRGLREIIKYNSKGNFDCISTLLLGMFDIRENFDLQIKERAPTIKLDDFWSRPHFVNN